MILPLALVTTLLDRYEVTRDPALARAVRDSPAQGKVLANLLAAVRESPEFDALVSRTSRLLRETHRV